MVKRASGCLLAAETASLRSALEMEGGEGRKLGPFEALFPLPASAGCEGMDRSKVIMERAAGTAGSGAPAAGTGGSHGSDGFPAPLGHVRREHP